MVGIWIIVCNQKKYPSFSLKLHGIVLQQWYPCYSLFYFEQTDCFPWFFLEVALPLELVNNQHLSLFQNPLSGNDLPQSEVATAHNKDIVVVFCSIRPTKSRQSDCSVQWARHNEHQSRVQLDRIERCNMCWIANCCISKAKLCLLTADYIVHCITNCGIFPLLRVLRYFSLSSYHFPKEFYCNKFS